MVSTGYLVDVNIARSGDRWTATATYTSREGEQRKRVHGALISFSIAASVAAEFPLEIEVEPQ